jgi:hypothetical protein
MAATDEVGTGAGDQQQPAGIIPHDIAGRYHCQECGQPLMNRLLFDTLGACEACNAAITRHRCTEIPPRDSFLVGEGWECPDCGSTWIAIEEDDTCNECGRDGLTRETWKYQPGDRLDEAPKREPQGHYAPFRDVLKHAGSKCHATASGMMVHIKPGCQCRTIRPIR